MSDKIPGSTNILIIGIPTFCVIAEVYDEVRSS